MRLCAAIIIVIAAEPGARRDARLQHIVSRLSCVLRTRRLQVHRDTNGRA